MRIRSLIHGLLLLLMPAGLFAAAPPDDAQRNFSVSEKTDIPGATLVPGIYSIRVLDHLTDRLVITIENTSSGKPVTFLAVNGSSLPSGAGPLLWAQGQEGRKALRGFRFPDGSGIEFVYPKADAVALAKANSEHVVAIDPASEGRVSSKLSGEDMQLVNLWLLTPTKVGPDEGIKAQRYQEVASANTQPDLLNRSTSTPSPVVTPTSSTVSAPATPAIKRVTPEVARVKAKPVIAKLPHTAGPMPMVWLLAIFSFAGAGFLRLRRA